MRKLLDGFGVGIVLLFPLILLFWSLTHLLEPHHYFEHLDGSIRRYPPRPN